MKYEDLIILLPCHSLEDFPLHYTGADAAGLLASWSGLWHPRLVASAGKIPSWRRAEDPPETLGGKLLVAPAVSLGQLPTGLAQRAQHEGCVFVRKPATREELLDAALAHCEPAGDALPPDLAADFLALGYCYLQVELLTRQMRYASSLDTVHFQNTVVAAAQAAVAGNEELAREKLAGGFDLLAEERGRYYPVDACLLDLTLVAPTTLGAPLRHELASTVPGNIWLSGATLTALAQETETLDALRAALAGGNCGLVGGEYEELRLPLVAAEALLANLQQGLHTYERLLGRRPAVFGRRRFGLTPLLPQVLARLGFSGALHATLDGGVLPTASQAKVRWEGTGGGALEALARPPRDANDHATFLSLAQKLGESMDSDHVATLVLAHWPGQVTPWHADLKRIARYGNALGKFVTVEAYFRDTAPAAEVESPGADAYASPYLRDGLVRERPDILSGPQRYWGRVAAEACSRGCQTLAATLGGTKGVAVSVPWSAANSDEATGELAQEFDAAAAAHLATSCQELAQALPRSSEPSATGYLVLNATSHVRRMALETPGLAQLPSPGRPIYAVGEGEGCKHVVADVPPMGYLWLPSSAHPPRLPKLPEPLAEEGVLRNEYFEVHVNQVTGSLRSVHQYGQRGNRLSQQLAFRFPSPRRPAGSRWEESDEAELYSVMAADRVAVTASTHALGEITSEGRLLDRQGRRLAGFRQVYRLWRGSRVLRITIELNVEELPLADPWNSYYAARFAWPDEAADLFRAVNETRHAAQARKLECPLYFEIAGAQERTCVFTGGLPFHRRVGPRMLDSLLVVRGETARRFEMGIGLDVAHPVSEALSLLMPATQVEQTARPPAPPASWLFHLDAKNVRATWWAPLCEENRVAGVRLRVLETAGRPARGALASFRPWVGGRKLDFSGRTLAEGATSDGKLAIELAAGEFAEYEARW